VFCVYLRTNSDLCHLHHILIGFYNPDEKCLQRGTDWGFKLSGLRFVFKWSVKYITLTQHGLHFRDRNVQLQHSHSAHTCSHTHHCAAVSSPRFITAHNPKSLQQPLLPKLRTQPGQSKGEKISVTQSRNRQHNASGQTGWCTK